MAVPIITATNMATISNADSTTGWVAFGGAMFAVGSDLLKEGTNAIFIEAKSVARQGAGFDVGVGNELDLTVAGTKLFIWINVISQDLVNTFANDGVTVVVSSDATYGTNDGHYTVGGSDIAWIGAGWKLIVVDTTRAFDITTGSPVKSSIRLVGVTADWVNTVGKAPSLNIDIMRQGVNPNVEITSPSHTGSADLDFNDNGASEDTIVRAAGSWITDGFEAGDKIEVTSTTNNNKEFTILSLVALTINVATGSVVDEQNTSGKAVAKVTFDDIVIKDGPTDDTEFGIISKDRNDNFELNGHIIFGDVSGALDTFIQDTNQNLFINQEYVESGFIEMEIVKDTGITNVRFGTEVGSGNDSRGVGGGLIKAIGTSDYIITATDTVDEFSIWGGVVDGATSILLKHTNIEWVGCTVQNCGQIQLESGAEMREGFITDSIEGSGVGAIKLIANPTDPEFRDMTLINNFHAMENEINGPLTWDLRNVKFAGNTADIRFNHASGLLTVNVLELGDTPTTSDGGGGGTITIVNAVNIDIHCERKDDNSDIQNVRVLVRKVSDGSTISTGLTDVNGDFSDTFDFTSDEAVEIEARKSTLPIPRYFAEFQSGTITANGLSTNFLMREDTIAVQA